MAAGYSRDVGMMRQPGVGTAPSRPSPSPSPSPSPDLVHVSQLLSSPHFLHHQVPQVTLRFKVSFEDFFLGHHFNFQSRYSEKQNRCCGTSDFLWMQREKRKVSTGTASESTGAKGGDGRWETKEQRLPETPAVLPHTFGTCWALGCCPDGKAEPLGPGQSWAGGGWEGRPQQDRECPAMTLVRGGCEERSLPVTLFSEMCKIQSGHSHAEGSVSS